MSTNFVFVLDADRRPLSPCHPARARELLRRGKASVLRRFPFTIILKRTVTDPVTEGCQVKLDPGSKTTGIAIVQGDRVIWGAEVTHRGAMIKKTLADRSARRRNRRSRLRYRKPSYRTKAQVNNAKRTYEHIRPRSKGGSDRLSNLTLACTKCNQKKGNKPVEVFLAKKPRKNKKGEPQIRPLKPIHGYRSGDIAKCGDVQGRISPRTSGSFEIRPPGGKPFSRPMRFFTPIHRNDGFEYGT